MEDFIGRWEEDETSLRADERLTSIVNIKLSREHRREISHRLPLYRPHCTRQDFLLSPGKDKSLGEPKLEVRQECLKKSMRFPTCKFDAAFKIAHAAALLRLKRLCIWRFSNIIRIR